MRGCNFSFSFWLPYKVASLRMFWLPCYSWNVQTTPLHLYFENGHWHANKMTLKLDTPKYGCWALWKLIASSCRKKTNRTKQEKSICNYDTHFQLALKGFCWKGTLSLSCLFCPPELSQKHPSRPAMPRHWHSYSSPPKGEGNKPLKPDFLHLLQESSDQQ